MISAEAMPREIKLTQYRVIVASPSDVKAERNVLSRIIEMLNRSWITQGAYVDLVRWETNSSPGFHVDGPQGRIDPILKIEDADLFIGIFWPTFGTPTHDGMTGTEHEFFKAYENWKAFKTPEIMFYFKDRSYKTQNSS